MASALRPKSLALFAGLLAGGLTACDVTIKDGDVSINHSQGRAQRDWARKYPLEAGGRVEIVNVNGPVEVVPGADGTVEVAVVLSAHAMTEDRAKQILSEADIEESVTPQHVRLATARRSRSRGGGGLEASYKVTAPRSARLEINGNNGDVKVGALSGHVKVLVVNGDVELTGLTGSVDAASVNGPLTVKMDDITDRVRVESTNGRVSLELPKDAKATLNVRAINGRIDVSGLDTQEVSGQRIKNLESVLNGGGPEIDLRVMNGRISVTGVDRRSGAPAR